MRKVKPTKKPRTDRFVRLTPEAHAAVEKIADERDLPMVKVASALILDAVEHLAPAEPIIQTTR